MRHKDRGCNNSAVAAFYCTTLSVYTRIVLEFVQRRWQAPWEGLPRLIGVSMKLLLIQGANMEYLGRRQPELYGTTSAKELDAILRRRAHELDVELDILYTNTEGEAVSAIYRAERANIDGILFNPAGFLHAGHALRDCLRSINAPAIEIHMTNIEKRGYGSVTSEAAVGMIAGFGVDSYLLALEAMAARLRQAKA